MGFDTLLENILTGIFGSMNLASIMIMAFFIICLILIGLNVRFSVLATMPLGVTFSQVGWLDTWVEGAYWIFIVAFGLYTIWSLMMETAY